MTRTDPDPQTPPDLTVVVAAWPDGRGLGDCLAALGPQLDAGTEVLVVGPGDAPAATAGRPRVRPLVADGLIPELWGAGIREARGGVVAITTAHFRPAAGWVVAIREAHARLDSPGVGGPIDPPRGRGPVNWATYFLRYSAYLGYDREADVPDLAGDNASYKRAALDEHPDLVENGFWELDFHRRVRAAGRRLTFVPGVRVTQTRSFGFVGFLAQRFEHGRQYGGARWAGRGRPVRLAVAAATPLIPAVFLAKIVRRVARSGRNFGPFVAAAPALLGFLAAWSLGEGYGALRPRRPPPRPAAADRPAAVTA